MRTLFQKNEGSLGTSGSASHNFTQIGIIKIHKDEISDEKILDLAIDAGAQECFSFNSFHEVHCNKNELYNIKQKLETKVNNFLSTNIEWRSINKIKLSKDAEDKVKHFIESLNDDDDVQKVYTNLDLIEDID